MRTKIVLAGSLALALLTSCSSVYKTGQTPDDVYYSPTRQVNAEIKKEEKKEDYTYSKADDNYLRMKVQNRRQWNTIDDRDYWYNYDCNCRCNNNWSTYNRWNGYDSWSNWNRGNNYYGYNSGWGYGYGYPIAYVRTPRSNTGPKPYMSGYTNRTYSNTNNSYSNGKNGSNNNSNFGNLLKSVFGGNSNTSNTNNTTESYSRPVRTFDNSNTNNSSSSSSSSTSTSNSSSGRTSTGTSTSTGRGQ
ncbi:MAG: hypothetical protein V4722_13015 [Bacteroidota bacterium]